MPLAISQFQPEEIDQAGRVLVRVPDADVHDPEWLEAAQLVGRWRASHAHPLNVFRTNLRRRANRSAVVAQRLKRLPSIIGKLQRLQRIPLSRMQDIGGCRVIASSAADAFSLAVNLADSKIRHNLIRRNNYIDLPRPSGYRGLHLVYAYNSDRPTPWQGLSTEIQFRSRLQHQWATSVETVGTFLGEGLKSGEGNPNWLRFFSLMSSVIAGREKLPVVPNTPTNLTELVSEVKEYDEHLGFSRQLEAFRIVTHQMQNFSGNLWVVLEVRPEERTTSASYFGVNNWEAANSHYLEREVETRDDPRVAVVLVSTNSLAMLRRAYPNFFMDLSDFGRIVTETVEGP